MLLDVGDVDGDGVAEVVLPHVLKDDARLSIFSQSRAGGVWTEHVVPYPVGAGTSKAVAVGDIDMDGRADLVLSTENARGDKRGVVWLRPRGSPFDGAWDVLDVSGLDGIKFDVNLLLDVDGDGDLDIVNTEESDGANGHGLGVMWYENPTRR